jgi:hypothetical protein
MRKKKIIIIILVYKQIRRTVPAVSWRNWGKPINPVRIAGAPI